MDYYFLLADLRKCVVDCCALAGCRKGLEMKIPNDCRVVAKSLEAMLLHAARHRFHTRLLTRALPLAEVPSGLGAETLVSLCHDGVKRE